MGSQRGDSSSSSSSSGSCSSSSSSSSSSSTPPHIDTDLYSRQIGTFGMEAMSKLVQLKVLISGLNGQGVEC
ncbi:hypothetical protein, conserved, partial [Eimeria acervulina]